MFSSYVDRLRDEVRVINSVIVANEAIRDELYSSALLPLGTSDGTHPLLLRILRRFGLWPKPAQDATTLLQTLLRETPGKVDWQTYDHCAALTRLYAAYERFVDDLISAYVELLPSLYSAYQDLPESVAINYRMGMGQILIKIGSNKQYRNLDETAVVNALYSGFGAGVQYKLVPQAFLLETANYRFDVLIRLLKGVGFDGCSATILSHKSLTEFITSTLGEADTVQGELERFVEYRNEAAHGTVDDLLSPEEIGKLGKFVCVLAESICDMATAEVTRRHLQLGHSNLIGTITEIHYKASIVIVRMATAEIRVQEDLYLCGPDYCRPIRVIEMQLDNVTIEEFVATEGQELGIKLSEKARKGNELRRLQIPLPDPIQQMPQTTEPLTTPDPEVLATEDFAGDEVDNEQE